MKNIPIFKSFMSFRSACNVFWLLIKSNSGSYIGEGPEVKAFEKEFGEKFGLSNVLALNSGTSALELAYELSGVGVDDEVITPVLTAPMTNLPILHRGGKVIFADCDRDLNIDIEDVKRKITPKTKALVFVHFGGNNRGLKEMVELSKEYNIPLIEDAAQAVGSDYWGKGDFVCVSLQAIKTLTSVDGGFLITKDTSAYEKAKRLRWFGFDRELQQKTGKSDIAEAGYKYHMNDVIATIGRGNLSVIDKIISHRKMLMEEYKKQGVDAHIWFALYFSNKRAELMKFLKERGVSTGIHHFRNDQYTVFGGKQKFKNMDELEEQYILLPLHHGMSVDDVHYICNLINEFNKK